jgi:hypothetical protein
MLGKGEGKKDEIKQLLNFRLSSFMIISVKFDFDPEDGDIMYF